MLKQLRLKSENIESIVLELDKQVEITDREKIEKICNAIEHMNSFDGILQLALTSKMTFKTVNGRSVCLEMDWEYAHRNEPAMIILALKDHPDKYWSEKLYYILEEYIPPPKPVIRSGSEPTKSPRAPYGHHLIKPSDKETEEKREDNEKNE